MLPWLERLQNDFLGNTLQAWENHSPSRTTASTADTRSSSSATMYVLYADTMVRVISAMGELYINRSQNVVAMPKARPVKGPPTASWTNSLHMTTKVQIGVESQKCLPECQSSKHQPNTPKQVPREPHGCCLGFSSPLPDCICHRKLLPFSKALQDKEQCEGCAIIKKRFRINKGPQSLGQTGLHKHVLLFNVCPSTY